VGDDKSIPTPIADAFGKRSVFDKILYDMMIASIKNLESGTFAAKAENEQLKERLEIGYYFQEVDGELKRVDDPSFTGPDGISCRDETIKLLDEENKRLRDDKLLLTGMLQQSRETVERLREEVELLTSMLKHEQECARTFYKESSQLRAQVTSLKEEDQKWRENFIQYAKNLDKRAEQIKELRAQLDTAINSAKGEAE
jgi:uncharacterized protein (DUF3084 family)